MDSSFLPLFVVIPMAAAFLIPLFAKLWQRSADLLANAAGAALLGISTYGAIYLFTESPALLYRMGGLGLHARYHPGIRPPDSARGSGG